MGPHTSSSLHRMKTKVLLATVVVLCVPVGAWADVAWDDPDGNADSFSWANGHNSDSNLFGNVGWFGGDSLYFLDSNFTASADDGKTSHTVTDTMDVDLTANPTLKFLSIAIYEYGDHTIVGGPANNVQADMDMWGYVPGHPMSPFAADFLFIASGERVSEWNDNATLLMEFAVPDVTQVHLTVTNTVVAVSDGAGGTASITGNFVLLGVAVTVIPEPASLSLLALGSLALLRRRR